MARSLLSGAAPEFLRRRSADHVPAFGRKPVVRSRAAILFIIAMEGIFDMSMLSQLRTSVPEIDNRSAAAASFFAEHEQLARDLMLAQDEAKSLKEQLVQTTNMVQLMTGELDAQKQLTAKERARANVWFGYTMGLVGRLAAIRGSIDSAEAIAQQAAAESANHEMRQEAVKDDPHDQQQLEHVVEAMPERSSEQATPLPKNTLKQ